MDVLLGVMLGVVLSAAAVAAWRLLRSTGDRQLVPREQAMPAALHASMAMLPHLRLGLTRDTAGAAVHQLLALTQSDAVALTDEDAVLACEALEHEPVEVGDAVPSFAARVAPDRVHVEPKLNNTGPPQAAVVAPLMVLDRRVGNLIAYYAGAGGVRPEDTRVVREAAALVGAQLALAQIDQQEERLADAELRALRAQISPHFIYNALAAVASYIHDRPTEARELLIEFAEFTRYAFRGQQAYVTLADELQYVQKYLRLEQARFGERLRISVRVDPGVLTAVVPVLSLQPLVENAVRHGVESPSSPGEVTIGGTDLGHDVELTITDSGAGMASEDAAAALAGKAGPGIGLSNVHSRLQQTFGPEYGLQVDSALGRGTTVTLLVPKFKAGVRAS